MKKIEAYKSFDGQLFETEEECRAHQRKSPESLIAGLTPETILDAIERRDDAVHISDAIERVARLIANKRKEQGVMRRRRSPKSDVPYIPPSLIDEFRAKEAAERLVPREAIPATHRDEDDKRVDPFVELPR
jgi:hypothetical protein